MALLEVKNLMTHFKTKRGVIKAVNDASYSVEAGKTLGIVGESGSGKSVSALSILHLLDANGYIASGQIIYDGRDITHLSMKELYKLRGNSISMIFQEPMTSLNPVFTIENKFQSPLSFMKICPPKRRRKGPLKCSGMLRYPIRKSWQSNIRISFPEVCAKGS